MKKVFWSFGLSLMMGIMLVSNVWAGTQKITVEVIALEIPTKVLNEFVSPGPLTTGFIGQGKAKVVSQVISPDSMDASKLVQSLKSLEGEGKVKILERIEITTLDGKPVTYSNLKDILYMEKLNKDTFKLKKMTGKDGEGTFFRCTPTLTKDGNIKVDCELTIRKMVGRVRVEGAEGLDIGLPEMSCELNSSSLILKNGESMITGGLVRKGKDKERVERVIILTARKEIE